MMCQTKFIWTPEKKENKKIMLKKSNKMNHISVNKSMINYKKGWNKKNIKKSLNQMNKFLNLGIIIFKSFFLI